MSMESEFDTPHEESAEAEAGHAEAGDIAPVVEGALARAPRPTADTAITREQRRSRRKREVRARTISVKRMTKRELEIGRLLYPETDYWKPRTREECADGPRPCPFVSCKHHLFIDVSARTGAIKLNFPDLEVWDLGESCALDVADRGGTTLDPNAPLLVIDGFCLFGGVDIRVKKTPKERLYEFADQLRAMFDPQPPRR